MWSRGRSPRSLRRRHLRRRARLFPEATLRSLVCEGALDTFARRWEDRSTARGAMRSSSVSMPARRPGPRGPRTGSSSFSLDRQGGQESRSAILPDLRRCGPGRTRARPNARRQRGAPGDAAGTLRMTPERETSPGRHPPVDGRQASALRIRPLNYGRTRRVARPRCPVRHRTVLHPTTPPFLASPTHARTTRASSAEPGGSPFSPRRRWQDHGALPAPRWRWRATSRPRGSDASRSPNKRRVLSSSAKDADEVRRRLYNARGGLRHRYRNLIIIVVPLAGLPSDGRGRRPGLPIVPS